MRLTRLLSLSLMFATIAVSAESKNAADYPLRVHVFNKSETEFYDGRSTEMQEARGEGRANLFEGGAPKGLEFKYDCAEKLRSSHGYDTYPAKWKKPGQELVVLMPVFAKSGSFYTCSFKTAVQDYVFATKNGKMHRESPDAFKAWMVKHDYDPEHGKNMPVKSSKDEAEAKPAP